MPDMDVRSTSRTPAFRRSALSIRRGTSAVKDAGRLQVEGQDYVVSDGDIMHIRFNV
jgi:ribosome-binding ATPase YchF (GTP1/OBG family)